MPKPVSDRKTFRQKIYEKYDGRCAYCGEKLTRGWQVDHIVPKYLGGSDNYDNLNPACRPCNTRKSVFTVEEYREHLSKAVACLRRASARFRMLERYGLIKQTKFKIVFFFEREVLFEVEDENSQNVQPVKDVELDKVISSDQSTFHLLVIRGEGGEDLVTVESDGTVKVHKEGCEPEAARIFWEAFEEKILFTQMRAVRRALAKDLLDELAESQNVQPMKDVRALYGTWPGEIDDGFEEVIEELRKNRKDG